MTKTGQDALTIEDIQDKLNNQFARIKANEENELEKNEEKEFYAYKKQYKGLCTKCGEYGHRFRPKVPEK